MVPMDENVVTSGVSAAVGHHTAATSLQSSPGSPSAQREPRRPPSAVAPTVCYLAMAALPTRRLLPEGRVAEGGTGVQTVPRRPRAAADAEPPAAADAAGYFSRRGCACDPARASTALLRERA